MTRLIPSLCLALLVVPASLRADALFIKRVVDGDTLVLSNNEKIRLIGVDTPEVHASQKLNKDAVRSKRSKTVIQSLGKQASRFVKQIAEGRPVRLEYEKSNRVSNHQDHYGRTLAYVYITPKNCDELEQSLAEQVCELPSYQKGFLNAVIVEAGYGNAYTKYPFKLMDDFRRLEKQAREANRGLWKGEGLRLTYWPLIFCTFKNA